ncbi:ATP-binding protein [Streptomyces profundus]|uniref:ATP-binding protein n=1 Tax=Streptomyces profundus TaxID=2867410 RepID=UPI001D168E91|nr:ATP-binding protein [Streptomyces sp. MA3_2.13]UED88083.1 ATP-binding protein [Streptomyces sp. MA3_2.13]
MAPLAATALQRSSRPARAARGEIGFSLPAELRTPRWARHRVRATLAAWGVAAEAAETVELVISELATNAVRHTATTTLRCRLTDTTDRLLVEVTGDHTGGNDPRPRDAATDEEGGRGLALVAALSVRWGVTTAHGGTAQCVWAELPRVPAEFSPSCDPAPAPGRAVRPREAPAAERRS